jgi:glycosyltransferase involved in cell wall biosynthesis
MSMDRPPLITALVCTRDRPDSLGPTLESLTEQAYARFEIVVVDQSRSDATERLVRRWAQARCPVRYVRLEQPGLSRAYNAGIESSKGSIIAFTDDDCVAPEGWLASVARAFDRHPQVALLYGQVLVPTELEAKENIEGITPALPIPDRRLLDHSHGFRVFGMGANFAARRGLFDLVGGFDEVLGGGGPLQSSQDFDFAYRVFRCRQTTLLEPDVVVFHYGFRSHAEWPATVRSYGIGVGGFYSKHIRAGDPYAARLLLGHVAVECARWLKHALTRQPARLQLTYLRNIASGMRRSFDFRVDRDLRLYQAR